QGLLRGTIRLKWDTFKRMGGNARSSRGLAQIPRRCAPRNDMGKALREVQTGRFGSPLTPALSRRERGQGGPKGRPTDGSAWKREISFSFAPHPCPLPEGEGVGRP